MVDSEPLVEHSLSEDFSRGCSVPSLTNGFVVSLVSLRDVYSPASSSLGVDDISGAALELCFSQLSFVVSERRKGVIQ